MSKKMMIRFDKVRLKYSMHLKDRWVDIHNLSTKNKALHNNKPLLEKVTLVSITKCKVKVNRDNTNKDKVKIFK